MNEAVKKKKVFYTVSDFYEAIGGIITKAQIYRMIKAGEIPVRHIGSKVILSADCVENFISAPFETEQKGA